MENTGLYPKFWDALNIYSVHTAYDLEYIYEGETNVREVSTISGDIITHSWDLSRKFQSEKLIH